MEDQGNQNFELTFFTIQIGWANTVSSSICISIEQDRQEQTNLKITNMNGENT